MIKKICDGCGKEMSEEMENIDVHIYGLNGAYERENHYCRKCWKKMKKGLQKLKQKLGIK